MVVIIKKEEKNKNNIRQHYVPQFYLKNFANVKDTNNHWIYCFDKTKKEENIYPSNIKNIAQEKYFYETNSQNIENNLSKIEYDWSNSLNDIIKGNYKTLRNKNIRFNLAMFILIQFIRSLEIRRTISELYIQFNERVNELELKFPEDIQSRIKSDMKNENIKSQHINLLESFPNPEILFCLMHKKWFLIENKTNTNFWTSDNPVVLDNPDGRMGLLADNIHIYLPLTPRLCLGLLDGCNIRNINNYLNKNNNNFYSDRCKINDINKINKLNKLQAAQSTRHIFSKEEDLVQINELIDKDEIKKDTDKERVKSEIIKLKDDDGKEHTLIHFAPYDLD